MMMYYPTYLHYNPYVVPQSIEISPKNSVDLYNTVTGQFIARSVSGPTRFRLAGKKAAIIVLVPAGGTVALDGSKLLVEGVVVDFHFRGQ